MSKKAKKSQPHVIFQNKMFDFDSANASSVNDCTGLIPSAPHTRFELDSYNDILDYSPESANVFSDKHESV